MHIIQITASYKPAYIYGGPIMSVAKLCEGLSEAKLEIEVLTTTANGQTELDVRTNKIVDIDQVKVTYFKRWTKDHSHFSPALLWHLNKMLRQAQNGKSGKLQTPNSKLIIHIHAWWNLVSILSCLIAKWYNIPVILSLRGMLTNYTLGNRHSLPKKIIHNLIGKRLLKYCYIHATSAKEKDDVKQFIESKNVEVIPNLVNLGEKSKEQRTKIKDQRPKNKDQEARCQTPLTTEIFKIIFLSRIEEKKGLELLLDALAEIDFKWTLTIAGSGEEIYIQRLKLKAETLNISKYITWFGQVNDDQKFNLLAQHDLMALTSYNENFANVVIESLSVGTPVLISKEVGLADYVAKKDLGWITDLKSNAITKTIMEVYENHPKRQQIKNTGAEIIKADFEAHYLIEKYIKMYRDIINE